MAVDYLGLQGIHYVGSTTAATPALPSKLCTMVLVLCVKDKLLLKKKKNHIK